MKRTLRLTPIAALAALALAAPAAADTYKPTRFDDPAPNGCKVTNCSFREALQAANATRTPDTIILNKGTYEMEIEPAPGPDSGSFDVLASTTIKGAGVERTLLDANGLDRVVTAHSATPGAIRLLDLTVMGGKPAAAPSKGGGVLAIAEDGLVLRDAAVRDNSAEYGGGISTQRSTLKVIRSTIRGNAASEGAGIHVHADVVSEPRLTIKSSTISGNRGAEGAGVHADGESSWGPIPPRVYITNSTLANNRATLHGGGILGEYGAIVTLDNTTVAFNTADWDVTGAGSGGGLYQGTGAIMGLGDSIVAGNTVGNAEGGAQCHGAFSTLGGVARQAQGAPVCSMGGQTMFAADVGALADNGGPTQTVELLGGTAVGLALSCPKRDQRGVPRSSTACDAGAFERQEVGR